MSVKLREDLTPATCQKCGAANVIFNGKHGYYECKTCGNYWAYDENDPDCLEELIEEIISQTATCPACGEPYYGVSIEPYKTCANCEHEW